jgi:hypothetical protein
MANKDVSKKARVHVDPQKGHVSVDVNKSGTVSVYAGGGAKPKTRDNPKGEKHVEVGAQLKFGGAKKEKRKK